MTTATHLICAERAQAQWTRVPCAGSVPEVAAAYFPSTYYEDVVVNADMLQVGTNGETLKAIAYGRRVDPNTPGSSADAWVYAEDYGGNSCNFQLMMPNACEPDIALGAADAQNGSAYRAIIVYKSNNDLYADIWELDDVGLPGFHAVNLAVFGPLNNSGSGYLMDDYHNDPHVDMWSDTTQLDPATGLPTMHQFAIVWTEGLRKWPWCVPPSMINGSPWYPSPLPVTADVLKIATGDILTLSINPPVPLDTSAYSPDVACVYDHTDPTSPLKAEIVQSGNCSGRFEVLEYDVASKTATSVAAPAFGAFSPRIEAMSQYYGGQDYKWMVSATVSSVGMSPQQQVWNFYPTSSGLGQSWASGMYPLPSDSDIKAPCVAAGVSPYFSSDIGNQQYTIGFYPRTKTDLTEIAWTTNAGLVSNNYYIPNCLPVNYHWDAARSMAVTNCSNSGLDLLTAWYDGASIIYKHSPNAMVFRPGHTTGISTAGGATRVTAYPNPASDLLHLRGATAGAGYQLTDLSGRTVQNGTVGKEQTIAVQGLAPGSYLLRLSEGGNSQTIRFTKQ
jgi:hypothetical protein